MIEEFFSILFNYKDSKLNFQGRITSPMKSIFMAFKNKLKISDDINLRFEYNHEVIDEDKILGQFIAINQIRNKTIEILVIEENQEPIKILSEEIICPECQEEAFISKITDDKVTFWCNNNHFTERLKADFTKTQMIDLSKIVCKCKSSNIKRFCLTCKETLCISCEKAHNRENNNEHKIIDYSQKNCYCLEHNKGINPFNSYCKTCKKNLCWLCKDDHENHQIEKFKEIYDFKDKFVIKQKAFSSILKKLEQAFQELINQMNNFKYTCEMNEIIIKNYNIDNRNYIKLKNYKEIYENNFNLQKLNNFVKSLNNVIKINNKYEEINVNIISNKIQNEEVKNVEIKEYNSIISVNKLQILNKVNNSSVQRINEKIESYNEKENNIDISENDENIKEDEKQDDEYISENNNFKYEISINENALQNDKDIYKNGVNNHNKIIEPFYKSIGENDIREDDKNEDEESINKNENIEEKYNCNENNQENIQNKNYLIVFKSNENAVQENQIKMYYNTNNIHKKKIQILGKNFVKKYNGKCHIIFKNKKYDDLTECFDVPVDGKNLEIFLESIDKITDASEMFADCDLLYKIDGISEWDTSNITNMSGMFMNCKSLESLEGLSNFNLVNCTNINYMFSGCRSLRLLPDISGWNTNNITNMFNLFENCESLSSLPDISKWNIKSVTNIKCIFSGCKSLETLPDLSKWNVNSVTDMSHLFEKCENLKILPEISEWDAKNVTNMEKMFYCCLKLEEIKIFKKVYKVENINYLYYGCKSLKKEPDLKGWNLNNIRNKKNFNSNCFHLKNKIKYNL